MYSDSTPPSPKLNSIYVSDVNIFDLLNTGSITFEPLLLPDKVIN